MYVAITHSLAAKGVLAIGLYCGQCGCNIKQDTNEHIEQTSVQDHQIIVLHLLKLEKLPIQTSQERELCDQRCGQNLSG